MTATELLMSDYVRYFEHIATLHPLLKHSETEKRFGILELNEYEISTKASLDLSHPCLFVSIGVSRIVDNQADNLREVTPVSLLILQNSNLDDTTHQIASLHACKRIAYQCIARLKADATQARDIVFDYNSVEISLLTDVLHIGTVGCFCTIVLNKAVNNILYYQQKDWQ
jgi:hypothetical protein